MIKRGNVLSPELAKFVQETVREHKMSFQPRPRSSRRRRGGGGESGTFEDFPLVTIQNVSGSNLVHGSIVGYGAPQTAPPYPPKIPVFNSGAPKPGSPFAVLLDDIPINSSGNAGPVGVLPVSIDITNIAHTKADCIANNYTRLKSGDSGPATILWKATSTTGVQYAWILLGGDPTANGIRGIVYSTITACTGTPTGNHTPGKGMVKFAVAPTGGIATPWTPGTDPVEVENWSHSSIAVDKEVLLRLSRVDNGTKIYEVLPSGGGATSTIRFARAYTAITAATNNLAASMGNGSVKYQDNATGVLDNDPTEVDNPLIGVTFVADSQVEVDTTYDPPRVINGTCGAVAWA